MNFFDLIEEHHNVFSDDLCERIISRFETDSRRSAGKSGYFGGDDKLSTDLQISGLSGWEDIDSEIYDILSPYFINYAKSLEGDFDILPNNLRDCGYQIQKTEPGQFFKEHSDFCIDAMTDLRMIDGHGNQCITVRERIFTYIIYLNDRKGIPNGRTRFRCRKDTHHIEAETGKLLLFPAYSFYVHEGEELESGVKYLMTGWGTGDRVAQVIGSADDYDYRKRIFSDGGFKPID